MKIVDYLKSRLDTELINESNSLEFSIYNVECYGVGDLVLLDAIEKELDKRGYKTKQVLRKTIWEKKVKV